MKYRKIPNETIRRLPIYLRGLLSLLEQGHDSISSGGLADFLGMNSSQIRKDVSYFGDFGTRGVGYDIRKLARQIRKILHLEGGSKAALVGVGNLGSAILTYPGFAVYGFEMAAAFDVSDKRIGKKIKGITIEDVSKIPSLAERGISLGIIAVPRDAAQKVVDAMVKAGVKGILNFSPSHVMVPKRVKVITIDIAMDLARLPFYIPAG